MKKGITFFACFLILTCGLSARMAFWAEPSESASRISAPTDYFRSAFSGEWNDLNIWESSADNMNWFPATIWPGSIANTITIRSSHFVNVSNNQDMDQVVIANGGVLSHLGGILTINAGPGDDMIVQSGGTFTLASLNNPPLFAVATATANINTGAVLRVAATGLTDAAPNPGVNVLNYFFQSTSVLEYTPILAFSTAGVIYFPNAAAGTIPVFRTTGNVGPVGGGTATIFNGVFEANGTITFQNSGTKTFRNGITGTGTVTASTSPLSGKFIINGITASLGGSGQLILNANGMDIGASTSVTLLSDKSITGNIALLPANALITLGNFNLTMTGNISGGSATSHVVTNGSGKLVLNNIAGATPRIFPVGANATTINPMAIFNGGGFNYGARVEIGLNPAIAVPVAAVNRTWIVRATGGNPGTVNVNFFYAAADCNAGWSAPPATLELGLYTSVWNVIQTGLTQAGSYQVATTVSSFAQNVDAPLVLANIGAILPAGNAVAVNYFTGIKQNSNHLLKWKLTCNSTATVNMIIERSNDGRNYQAVYAEDATALRCEQPFYFTDNQPAAGVNYYRIKITDADGKITYSSIVSLLNAAKGIDILNIAPNPIVNGSFNLQISAAEKMQLQIIISDMQGRVMQKQNSNMIAGFNSIPFNVKVLAKGTYQLSVYTFDNTTRVLRFVVK